MIASAISTSLLLRSLSLSVTEKKKTQKREKNAFLIELLLFHKICLQLQKRQSTLVTHTKEKFIWVWKNPYSEIGVSLFDPTFLIFSILIFSIHNVTLPLLIIYLQSHNHRTVSFGKDIKDHLDAPSPAMSRDTFH